MHPIVVGIAGGSASGKSTLTAVLRPKLEESGLVVRSFGLDAYFWKDMTQSPTVTLPSGSVFFNRNHPDSADLERLLKDVEQARGEADILLLEGHFLLVYERARALMDLKVYVDLEPDVRALRRLVRDMKGGRGDTDPAWIAEYFLECAKKGHDQYIEPSKAYADFVVRGDADPERTADLLRATILGIAQCRMPNVD